MNYSALITDRYVRNTLVRVVHCISFLDLVSVHAPPFANKLDSEITLRRSAGDERYLIFTHLHVTANSVLVSAFWCLVLYYGTVVWFGGTLLLYYVLTRERESSGPGRPLVPNSQPADHYQ